MDFTFAQGSSKIRYLFMGLFRGAVFHHGGVPKNSPLALMGLQKAKFGVWTSSGEVGVFLVKGWGSKSLVCPSKTKKTKVLAEYPGKLPRYPVGPESFQVGMIGNTFSIKVPKACSKKFAATFQGTFLTRGNVLRLKISVLT